MVMMMMVLAASSIVSISGKAYGTPQLSSAPNGLLPATNVQGSEKVTASVPQTSTVIVQGTVVDQSTGRPILKFWVTKGVAPSPSSSPELVVFNKSTAREYVGDGHFVSTFQHFPAGFDTGAIRVDAEGYQPEVMVLPGDNSPVKLCFLLVRARNVTVLVLNPDGTPTASVNMVQTRFGYQGFVDTSQHPDQTYSPVSRVTGADGRFSFLGPVLGGYEEVVYNSVGYAAWSSQHPPSNGVVTLTRWGSVGGQALVALNPAAGREVEADVVMPCGPSSVPLAGAMVLWYSRTGTDAEGRFLVNRLPAGEATVALLPGGHGAAWQEIPPGVLSSEGPTRSVVKVTSGQTTITIIGGVGQLVQGVVQIPAALMATREHWGFWLGTVRTEVAYPATLRPPMPQNVASGSIIQKLQWIRVFSATPAGKALLAKQVLWLAQHSEPIWTQSFVVEPDGSFSLPGMPPGTYQILIPAVRTDNMHLTNYNPPVIAMAGGTFTVPPLRGPEPSKVPLKIQPLQLVPTDAVPSTEPQQQGR